MCWELRASQGWTQTIPLPPEIPRGLLSSGWMVVDEPPEPIVSELNCIDRWWFEGTPASRDSNGWTRERVCFWKRSFASNLQVMDSGLHAHFLHKRFFLGQNLEEWAGRRFLPTRSTKRCAAILPIKGRIWQPNIGSGQRHSDDGARPPTMLLYVDQT